MLSESFRPFFEWCGRTWLGTLVRDTVWAFPVLETFHLLALAVLLGSILIVNLRVLRSGKRDWPTSNELEPWIRWGIVVLVVSGIPMFLSEPQKCYESISFPVKIIFLAVGIAWHFTSQRRLAESRLAACFSILLWTGIGLAGKGIPYV